MKHSKETGTDPRNAADENLAAAGSNGPVSTSRRRFTRAGLSGSVLMTLASRPALAGHCSVSGTISGNLSRPDHGERCVGLTPGYWKTHPEWRVALGGCYEAGLCNPITKKNGQCKDYYFVTFGELRKAFKGDDSNVLYTEYMDWANWDENTDDDAWPELTATHPPTTLSDAFAGQNTLVFADSRLTMMQAFWDPPEDFEPRTLIAHATAALLNACRFGEEAFGYTPASLIDFIGDWPKGDYEGLKDALAMLNERGT